MQAASKPPNIVIDIQPRLHIERFLGPSKTHKQLEREYTTARFREFCAEMQFPFHQRATVHCMFMTRLHNASPDRSQQSHMTIHPCVGCRLGIIRGGGAHKQGQCHKAAGLTTCAPCLNSVLRLRDWREAPAPGRACHTFHAACSDLYWQPCLG